MTDWITLQDAAEIIGVRKGTLAMWRLRNRFPFRTKGKGRGLRVSRNSVQSWVASGGKAGVRPGRPAKSKAGRKPGRPPKAAAAGRAGKLKLRTTAGLEDIQQFVAAIKGGGNVRVVPDGKGYVLSLDA